MTITQDGRFPDSFVYQDSMESGVIQCPADKAQRGAWADWLIDRGDPRGELQSWLARTGRYPIHLPYGNMVFFKESGTFLPYNTVPARLSWSNLVDTPREIYEQLLKCFEKERRGSWLRKGWEPETEPVKDPGFTGDVSLKLVHEYTTSEEYGGTSTHRGGISLVSAVDRIARGSLSGRLYFDVIVDRYHLPVVDADSSTVETIAWLRRHNMGYLHMQSSPGRSWIIFDFPVQDFDNAMLLVQHHSENDINYINMCRGRKMFSIRAEIRGSKPSIIENRMTSSLGKKWAEKFLAHWANGALNEIYRYRANQRPTTVNFSEPY